MVCAAGEMDSSVGSGGLAPREDDIMKRKLVLHRETLRNLEDRKIQEAQGGAVTDLSCASRCIGTCSCFTCINTCYLTCVGC